MSTRSPCLPGVSAGLVRALIWLFLVSVWATPTTAQNTAPKNEAQLLDLQAEQHRVLVYSNVVELAAVDVKAGRVRPEQVEADARTIANTQRDLFKQKWSLRTPAQLADKSAMQVHAEDVVREAWQLMIEWSADESRRKAVRAPRIKAFGEDPITKAPKFVPVSPGKEKFTELIDKVRYDPDLKGAYGFFQVYPIPNRPGHYERELVLGPLMFKERRRSGQIAIGVHELYHAVEFQRLVERAYRALSSLHPDRSADDLLQMARDRAYRIDQLHFETDAERRKAGRNYSKRRSAYYAEERMVETWTLTCVKDMLGLSADLMVRMAEYVRINTQDAEAERKKRLKPLADRLKDQAQREADRKTREEAERIEREKAIPFEYATMSRVFATLTDELKEELAASGVELPDGPVLKARLFDHSITEPPVFGGIILGNRPAASTLRPRRAKIVIEKGQPYLDLILTGPDGDIPCRYTPASGTELWVAHRVVRPLDVWRNDYFLDGTESSLVSCEVDHGSDRAYFAMHPALVGNPIGRAAQQADLLYALQAHGLFENMEPVAAMQWYDEVPVFRVHDGRLIIIAAKGPPHFLLRPTFWGPHDPRPGEFVAEQQFLETFTNRFLRNLLVPVANEAPALPLTKQSLLRHQDHAYRHADTAFARRHPYHELSALAHAPARFDCLRVLDSFARTLAVLNWIADAPDVDFPALAAGIEPEVAETPQATPLSTHHHEAMREFEQKSVASNRRPYAWWRAPSPDRLSIPGSHRAYEISVEGIKIGVCRESEERLVEDGVPCHEWRRRLEIVLPDGSMYDETYRLLYQCDAKRTPWAASITVSARQSGQTTSESVAIRRVRGQWRLMVEKNGSSIQDDPWTPLPEGFLGFDAARRDLTRSAFGAATDGTKPPSIEVGYCPDDPRQFAHDSFVAGPWETFVLQGVTTRLRRIEIRRDRNQSDSAALSLGLASRRLKETIWIDPSNQVVRRELQLERPRRSPHAPRDAREADHVHPFLDHPHVRAMIESGHYALNKDFGLAPGEEGETFLFTLVTGRSTLRAETGRDGFTLTSRVPPIVLDQPLGPQGSVSRATLRLEFENPPEQPWLVQTRHQKVVKLDDRTYELHLLSPSHHADLLDVPDTAWETELCLQSTFGIEASHSTIQAASTSIIGGANALSSIRALKTLVQISLRSSYRYQSRFLSAAQALALREGDCSECALLLAALARARSIPARIALGFVYVPDAETYMGHAWTELYVNGRWRPVDATRDTEVDATYIKVVHLPDLILPLDFRRMSWEQFNKARLVRVEVLDQAWTPDGSLEWSSFTVAPSDGRSRSLAPAEAKRAAIQLALEVMHELAAALAGQSDQPAKDGDPIQPIRIRRPPAADLLGIDLPPFHWGDLGLATNANLAVVRYLSRELLPVVTPQLKARYGEEAVATLRWAIQGAVLVTLSQRGAHVEFESLAKEFSTLARQCKVSETIWKQFLEESRKTRSPGVGSAEKCEALLREAADSFRVENP